ncbi:hypothetical protein XU18_1047 [Perkinsela sp. CCAP 1560/4]|nr:hypothetical protein XU18_1047 [Perkinsela sp. CCAP 1560/4]|eukprot:KNH08478.1 hypothetical protein XU18_1047 [Perkinsela sp. CCAP 1560/4]
MVKKSKGDLSKRCTLKKKYSIIRHVRDHRRDVRRALKNKPKRTGKALFRQEKAILRLPNKHSQKDELLAAMLAHRQEKRSGRKAPDDQSEETAAGEASPQEGRDMTPSKEEQMDFTLQLAHSMEMSDLLVYVVDGRAPLASISETMIALWKSRGIPILLLLAKREVTPVAILEKWVEFFKRDQRFDSVMLYQPEAVVEFAKKLCPSQKSLSVTVLGLPNTGVSKVRADLEALPKWKFSVHDSYQLQQSELSELDVGSRFIFLPEDAELVQQPFFGLDCIFRDWKTIIQKPALELILSAEEILSHFPTELLTLHYKLANEHELTPRQVLDRIKQHRGQKDMHQTARDVVADFHSSRLKWCCLPPGSPDKFEELDLWTFLDEALLSTQDFMMFDNSDAETSVEEEEEEQE